MNEEIKRKADELVGEHLNATMSFLNERQRLINATKNAILSTKNTIEALEALAESTKIQDMYEANVCDAIDEQTAILTELESRI